MTIPEIIEKLNKEWITDTDPDGETYMLERNRRVIYTLEYYNKYIQDCERRIVELEKCIVSITMERMK